LANIKSKLAKGTAWIAGARAATNALGFISTLVLARLLTPADFGLVALGTTMLAILTSVTDLSLTSALVQHKDPQAYHFHSAWTLQVLRGLILATAFALISIPASHAFNEPRLIGVMVVLSGSVFLQGLSNPRAIMLTRQLVFWQQFMLQVGAKFTALIVATAIAFYLRSYWALVWGTVAGQIVALLLSYTVLPFRPRLSLRGGRDLIAFSVWLTFGQMINTINWKSDQLFIGAYLGRTALGHYTVGDNLAVIPTRELTSPITQTLFPAFSKIRDDLPRLREAYQKSQAFVTAVALPAGVGTALIAYPLVELTMGAKWLPSVFIIQALAAVFAFQTLGSLSQPLAIATGNTKLLFQRDLQGFVIRFPTIIAGMYMGGLTGIVYARIITGSLAIFLHMRVVEAITQLSYWQQLVKNKRSILSVMAMAILTYTFSLAMPSDNSSAHLAIKIAGMIVTGALAYVGSHYALWILDNRPSGPETEIGLALKSVRMKISG